jgi:hypothetical protein
MSDRRGLRGFDLSAGGAAGDIISELRKEGHISDWAFVTFHRFLHDLRCCHGTSDGIVGQLAERVQTSTRSRLAPPGGGDPDAYARVRRVLDRMLDHERQLFGYLVKQRELARGSLSDFGKQTSGYRTNKTSRAYSVGRISGLVATVAELWSGQDAVGGMAYRHRHMAHAAHSPP